MARIYTKTGDKGETGLIGGSRVRKSTLRMHAVGELDETNAAVGLARALFSGHGPSFCDVDSLLERVQNHLFDLGAELADPATGASADKAEVKASPAIEDRKAGAAPTFEDQIRDLEGAIDRLQADLEPLANFILPGGTHPAAALHLARTICRRAERAVVALAENEVVGTHAVSYLNRLSDLLFVLARTANKRLRVQDVRWRQEDIK